MRTLSLLLLIFIFSAACKEEKNIAYTDPGKLLALNTGTVAESERLSHGVLQTIDNFPSKHVRRRSIYVWLPVDYYSKPSKHAVLYMHDGQMLFDPETTWNKQEWGVDETLTKLMLDGIAKNTIVVGIWSHSDTRHSEYFPQKPFESLTQEQKDAVLKTTYNKAPMFKEAPAADSYLKFIVEELKPYIDKNFSTLPDRENTYIAGSSMGGLISMYAVCEYPEIFGGAACLSTHWIGTVNSKNNPLPQAFADYMTQKLPDPATHKFYFDYGTRTLDAFYGPSQLKVDKVMKAKGYTPKNWMTKKFNGHDHSENSWKKRLHIPLTFLLKK
ncbi:MAG: alpha/beta hydrolase [Sinomicrobium sp.]|nr:alpha/beta hydrolase [Sinomicrobium sp.]